MWYEETVKGVVPIKNSEVLKEMIAYLDYLFALVIFDYCHNNGIFFLFKVLHLANLIVSFAYFYGIINLWILVT